MVGFVSSGVVVSMCEYVYAFCMEAVGGGGKGGGWGVEEECL